MIFGRGAAKKFPFGQISPCAAARYALPFSYGRLRVHNTAKKSGIQ